MPAKKPRRRGEEWNGLSCEQVVADLISGRIVAGSRDARLAERHLLLQAVALHKRRAFGSQLRRDEILSDFQLLILEKLRDPEGADAIGMSKDFCGRTYNFMSRVLKDYVKPDKVELFGDPHLDERPASPEGEPSPDEESPEAPAPTHDEDGAESSAPSPDEQESVESVPSPDDVEQEEEEEDPDSVQRRAAESLPLIPGGEALDAKSRLIIQLDAMRKGSREIGAMLRMPESTVRDKLKRLMPFRTKRGDS